MGTAVAHDGTRLAFEVFGRPSGETLLMIQGLGADRRGWIRQRPALAPRHRCIAFDNRGVGGSDKPPGPYDLEVMADDAIAVLDAAGVDAAHVMGASMGGVLAQIVAVRHPERVKSLVLSCTACRHHEWRRELLDEWAGIAQARGMGAVAQRAVRWLLGPRSVRRFRPVLQLLGPLAMNAAPHAFVAQVQAILDTDDSMRAELPGIRVPALVIVGSQDILTPLGDSEELVDLLPDARLAVVRGGAHGFLFEQARAFNQAVGTFLGDVGRGGAGVPAA
jgi:3-oxoadipate enol-lactonase